MNVVVNRCYGGFSLSHKAKMRYAELTGFDLFPFIEKRDSKGRMIFNSFVPCDPNVCENFDFVHYSTQPLTIDGRYVEGSYFTESNIERNDEKLVQVVEELGSDANGCCANLEIVEIPDDVEWVISDCDGFETIEEKHRSW